MKWKLKTLKSDTENQSDLKPDCQVEGASGRKTRLEFTGFPQTLRTDWQTPAFMSPAFLWRQSGLQCPGTFCHSVAWLRPVGGLGIGGWAGEGPLCPGGWSPHG